MLRSQTAGRPLTAGPAIVLVAGFVTAVVAAGCGSAAQPASPAGAPTAVSSTAPTTAASPSIPPTIAATLAPVTAAPITPPPATPVPTIEPVVTPPPPSAAPAVGSTVLVGDEQNVTVVAFEQWPGTATVKPRKGKVFMTVMVRVDGIKVTSFDSADFKLRDAGDVNYKWRPGRAPHLYSLDGLNPGSTYSGWITYEVPKNVAAGAFQLIYRPAFLPGSTYVFRLAGS